MNEFDNTMSKYLFRKCFFRALSMAIPFTMIDLVYDLPFPLFIVSVAAYLPLLFNSEFFFTIFEYIYSILLKPGLYIWAFVVTIQGEQDIIAIAFYIILGLQAFSIIKNFFYYVINLFAAFNQ